VAHTLGEVLFLVVCGTIWPRPERPDLAAAVFRAGTRLSSAALSASPKLDHDRRLARPAAPITRHDKSDLSTDRDTGGIAVLRIGC